MWRDDQALYMADIADLISDAPLVEDEMLILPSTLDASHRKTAWFDQLSKYKTDLRRGQADDALCGLRRALDYEENLQSGKQKYVHGNANSTRAVVLIRRARDLGRLKADYYRRAREALLDLGMPDTDKMYPELDDKHIVIQKKKRAYPAVGDSQYTGSWIWVEGPRGVLSEKEEDEWEEEGNVGQLSCPPLN